MPMRRLTKARPAPAGHWISIVTAIALSSAIEFANAWFGLTYSVWTIIIGHATFCIVILFNNVIARMRRVHSGERQRVR